MIGVRLKAERERLGLTQPVFAELAGAKKRTLIDWEGGVSSPTAVQLAALATHGVDVLYVLTGQHHPKQPESAPSAFSFDEKELLSDYRGCGAEGKAAVKAACKAAAQVALTQGHTGKRAT